MTKTIEILTMNDHFARSPAQDPKRFYSISDDGHIAELREHFGLAPDAPIVLQLARPAGPIFEVNAGTKIEVREDRSRKRRWRRSAAWIALRGIA